MGSTPSYGADFQTLYNAGQYQEALSSLAEQSDTPERFYNLGTVYFQLNQPGLAVAYLEKAARLKPYDLDTRHNLQLAMNSFEKLIGPDRVDPSSGIVFRLADQTALTIPVLDVGAALSVLALLFLSFTFMHYRKERQVRAVLQSKSGLAGCTALFLALLCLGVSALGHHFPAAIVLSPQIVRSGPGDQFLELSRVETGMKLRAQDTPTQENPNTTASPEIWRQVRYSRSSETQGIGWVRASSLLLL